MRLLEVTDGYCVRIQQLFQLSRTEPWLALIAPYGREFSNLSVATDLSFEAKDEAASLLGRSGGAGMMWQIEGLDANTNVELSCD